MRGKKQQSLCAAQPFTGRVPTQLTVAFSLGLTWQEKTVETNVVLKRSQVSNEATLFELICEKNSQTQNILSNPNNLKWFCVKSEQLEMVLCQIRTT